MRTAIIAIRASLAGHSPQDRCLIPNISRKRWLRRRRCRHIGSGSCGLSELHVGPHGQAGCRRARVQGDGRAAVDRGRGRSWRSWPGSAIERWTAWDLAGERRALEARAFELVTRAMAPGSALACLDAVGQQRLRGGLREGAVRDPRKHRRRRLLRHGATVAPGRRQGLHTARRRGLRRLARPVAPECRMGRVRHRRPCACGARRLHGEPMRRRWRC